MKWRALNFNIRTKFLFGLILVFLISVGPAIIIYNTEIKTKKLKDRIDALEYILNKINQTKVNLYKIKTLSYEISKDLNADNPLYYKKEIADLEDEAKAILNFNDKYLKIAIPEDKREELNIEDSIAEINNKYKIIFSTLNQMLKYKLYTLDKEEVKKKYKILIAQFKNLEVKYRAVDINDSIIKIAVVEDLIKNYNLEAEKHRRHILQIIDKSLINLTFLEQNIQNISLETKETIRTLYKRQLYISGVLFMISILLIFIIAYVFLNSIERPLQDIINTLNELTLGKLPDYKEHERKDELGLISEGLSKLIKGLKTTSEFAMALGKGDFNYNYKPLSSEDALGTALLEMKRSLLEAAKEEEKRKKEDFIRNRSAEATAKFAEILRQNQGDLSKLGDEVIINLVRFFNANQGMFFILNDKDKENPYLELLSAYAWNRKKYLDKKIQLGEGLVGAVAIEKFTVYMTDVPEDYIEIRSGTGDANPTSIVIVPLKVEEEVLGVIEIASFYEFEPYEIELIEKIGESIASTLKTVKINEQTTELLEKFQIQAAEMREQERVMKQTIEQLRKTQEESKKNELNLQKTLKEMEELNKQLRYKDEQLKLEIQRLNKENQQKLQELQKKEKISQEIIEKAVAAIITVNKNGQIEFANPAALELLGYTNDEIKKKKLDDIFDIIQKEDESLYQRFLKRYEEFKKAGGKNLKIKDKFGATKEVLVDIVKDDEEEFLIIFIKDLSLFKEQEKETQKTIEEFIKKELECLVKTEKLIEVLQKHNIPIPDISLEKDSLIKWSEKFEMGISTIDKQHKKWIEFINKLYKFLNEGKATDELDNIFRELIDYTNYHFGFEEKYMKEFNLAIYEEHKQKHKEFVDSLFELYNEFTSRKVDTPYKLVLFLKKWVEQHVLYEDRKYKDDFKKHGIS